MVMDEDDDFGDFEGPVQNPKEAKPTQIGITQGAANKSEPLPLELFGDTESKTSKDNSYSKSIKGPTYKKGDLVWYKQRDGSYTVGKVVAVDVAVVPASYGVETGDTIRETESPRLRPRTPGETCPPPIPTGPLPGPGSAPPGLNVDLASTSWARNSNPDVFPATLAVPPTFLPGLPVQAPPSDDGDGDFGDFASAIAHSGVPPAGPAVGGLSVPDLPDGTHGRLGLVTTACTPGIKIQGTAFRSLPSLGPFTMHPDSTQAEMGIYPGEAAPHLFGGLGSLTTGGGFQAGGPDEGEDEFGDFANADAIGHVAPELQNLSPYLVQGGPIKMDAPLRAGLEPASVASLSAAPGGAPPDPQEDDEFGDFADAPSQALPADLFTEAAGDETGSDVGPTSALAQEPLGAESAVDAPAKNGTDVAGMPGSIGSKPLPEGLFSGAAFGDSDLREHTGTSVEPLEASPSGSSDITTGQVEPTTRAGGSARGLFLRTSSLSPRSKPGKRIP
eukprot:jgi/Botrbrau1/6122/Bobra.331_2s0017.1